jgi:hypothetical protein
MQCVMETAEAKRIPPFDVVEESSRSMTLFRSESIAFHIYGVQIVVRHEY